MTTAVVGMFAHAAAIGWLAILFIVPTAPLSWRPFALVVALCAGSVLLSWWFGGFVGARVASLGTAAGTLGAVYVRFSHVISKVI